MADSEPVQDPSLKPPSQQHHAHFPATPARTRIAYYDKAEETAGGIHDAPDFGEESARRSVSSLPANLDVMERRSRPTALLLRSSEVLAHEQPVLLPVPGEGGLKRSLPSAVSMDTTDTEEPDAVRELDLETLPARSNLDSGLSDADVEALRIDHGFNEVVEKKKNPCLEFAKLFWGPIPVMIIVAAALSGATQSWPDFGVILGLLFLNAIVRFVEERNAGNAVAALQSSLALRAKVKRNNVWTQIPARELVPGDLVLSKLGDIVPADIVLVAPEHHELVIDQSALTGESLTVNKGYGETIYSGSVVRVGEMEGIVQSTGAKTFFGRSAALIASVNNTGHVQVVLFRLGIFLIVLSFIGVVIVVAVGISRRNSVLEILSFAALVVIASIPVALPTVLSVTMALGAHRLSRVDVIVARMTAVEELAGMDVLCSDKTGTLTKNQLTVDAPVPFRGFVARDVLHYAALASKADSDAIDTATLNAVTEPELLAAYQVVKFVPFDPIGKRTEVELMDPDGRTLKVSKGAPQVILQLCRSSLQPEKYASLERKFKRIVDEMAGHGFRAIAVARTRSGYLDVWRPIGVIPLFDPPRDDAAETIKTLRGLGIQVKMITGDAVAIARETASRLGMTTNILDSSIFGTTASGPGSHGGASHNASQQPVQAPMTPQSAMLQQFVMMADIGQVVERASGFAQVFPEHKFKAVEILQQHGHIVAMTGDGVNDAPALKKADIGIAVEGATDAARSAASVVLTRPGLSTIVNAVTESRRIFNRMKSYVIYQVHATLQLLLFLVLALCIYDFRMNGLQIVLLVVINDGTTLTISTDRVHYHNEPEKWNLVSLVIIGAAMAAISVGGAFIVFFIFQSLWLVPMAELTTVMYLQLAVSGQLTIFLARTKGLFFLSAPCWQLAVTVVAAQLLALFFSVYGVAMPAIGWRYAGIVWGMAALVLVVKEIVKLLTVRLLRGVEVLVAKQTRRHSEDAGREAALAQHSLPLPEPRRSMSAPRTANIPMLPLRPQDAAVSSPRTAVVPMMPVPAPAAGSVVTQTTPTIIITP
eukprot:TRINITY_DN5423_c0_g1_i4.p1 TRINITY_DN5423_c0_g1~~TRINITY_DN5423_c0_g1_i4.p1  ORF type:complete len:1048 (-),score=300.64 TRINITY_DN5423_c0_g1_i4:18-3161(-)